MSGVSVDEQYELDMLISDLVLDEMYEEDRWAELKIRIDDIGVHSSLVSETQPLIVFEDDLLNAISRLAFVHDRASTQLTMAVYSYRKESDGGWNMDVKFDYERT